MLSVSAAFVPRGARERLMAPLLRLALRLALKPMLAPEIPIVRQRRRIKTLARWTQPKIAVDVQSAVVGGTPGEWLRPSHAAIPGTILYLHGGGYCIGSAATHRAVAAHLAQRSGLPVFAADYRLAPEHPHPAAVEDANAAYRALAGQGPIVIAGDSAGGGLALAAALALRERAPTPAALVLFSPWIDLAAPRLEVPDGEAMLSARWLEACARHYLAGADVASPLTVDLEGLPPVLIQAGTDELLHDDAVRLHAALESAGVNVRCEIVPERWHAFQLHAGWLPSADAAILRAASFIAHNLM